MSRQVQESLEATDRRLDIRTRWTCSLAICMLQRTWDESRFVISAEIIRLDENQNIESE
jgi:hypothetical protein